MEEKLRFVFEQELQERTMTELCQRYEITRQTGYVWLRRYREAGAAERIEQILPHLDELVDGGLITLEKVRVILYRPAKK
jgi:transposase-like protein